MLFQHEDLKTCIEDVQHDQISTENSLHRTFPVSNSMITNIDQSYEKIVDVYGDTFIHEESVTINPNEHNDVTAFPSDCSAVSKKYVIIFTT